MYWRQPDQGHLNGTFPFFNHTTGWLHVKVAITTCTYLDIYIHSNGQYDHNHTYITIIIKPEVISAYVISVNWSVLKFKAFGSVCSSPKG